MKIIAQERYGDRWLAIEAEDFNCVPADPWLGDVEWYSFMDYNPQVSQFAAGDTPDEALANLLAGKMLKPERPDPDVET